MMPPKWGHANVTDQKLRAALIRDDEAESRGMHADDRETCHTCETWATYEHLESDEHATMTRTW